MKSPEKKKEWKRYGTSVRYVIMNSAKVDTCRRNVWACDITRKIGGRKNLQSSLYES